MSKKLFGVNDDRGYGKEISLRTPSDDLRIYVDNYDVNLSESIPLLERMLTILNDHWDDRAYAYFKPMTPIEDDEDGEKTYNAEEDRLEKLFKNFK